jgi:hypothetical protein
MPGNEHEGAGEDQSADGDCQHHEDLANGLTHKISMRGDDCRNSQESDAVGNPPISLARPASLSRSDGRTV